MAIVYLANDLRHRRDVAIKVLRPEFAIAVSAERFLREIQIEGQLKHPHILPLFDSGDVDGMPYYVMPYVPGESLRSRLDRETQLPLKDIVWITEEVADALCYAHEQGLVHRDVKPGNILLDESHAFLADFGIARAVTQLAGDRLSESGVVIGTPEYMSPEQCTEHGNVDPRSDVYALGCVVYEMLAGEPPFTGPTAQAVVARHLHERPRSLRVIRSSIPDHVEEAVEIALAKVPADRFTTTLEFVAALKQEAPTPQAISRVRLSRRRRVRRWTSLFLGGLAGLIGLSLLRYFLLSPSSIQSGEASSAALPLSSIAVMYLEDRSPRGKLSYLSAGLTEDLIDQLADVKSLRVISPDGVRPYRGQNVPVDSIADALHVGTLVTGTVDQTGERLRASVRLTDVATSTQIFSGTFEKSLGNVLELRDELSEEIARQLRIRLGDAVQLMERRAGTRNPAAWDLVHRAEELRNRALELGYSESPLARQLLQEADTLLDRAARLDSKWVEPTVLRGWLAYDQADRAADVMDTTRAAITAIERRIGAGVGFANQALRQSPGNPHALELRGTLLYRSWALTGLYGIRDTAGKLELAERDLRGAAGVAGRHHARALSTLSAVLEFSGKVAEANLAAEQAYEADAYLRDASTIMFRVFNTSLDMKNFEAAQRWCDRGRRAFPRDWTFLICQLSLLGWSPLVLANGDKAWAVLRQLDSVAPAEALIWIKPQMTMMVAAVLARAGLPDSAGQVIARAKADAPADPQLPYYEALARVRLQQPAAAAALLQQLLQRSPNLGKFLRSRSAFQPLWNDPRLRRLG